MANENGEPTAAEKGKGKMVEKDAPDGKKSDEVMKDKDGKPLVNGKKGDEPQEEELSEEDQQLKTELEMLVSRLKESDSSLYIPALDAIKDFIKTSTSSMTAVPKPLKFLMPHYDDLTKTYEQWPIGNEKSSLADVLSVLGMTQGDEEKLETLKYRLLAPSKDLGSWGHEYIRHLALEIGQDYNRRTMEDEDTQELVDLARTLVPYFLSHNAEADAVDLLSELERIQEVPQYLDENTYSRVCLYMVTMVNLLTYPDDQQFLRTAHDIYMQYNKLPQAMVLAIRMNDTDLIRAKFTSTKDAALKKQLALLVARQQIWLEPLAESEEDEELAGCLSNEKLPNHFKFLAKELNILDPKMPEDIYKSHLESSRTAGLTNVDSARHNLASAFVNGFTNAGFGADKLMLVEGDKTSWVFKTKDDGMISTTASMGMLLKWDTEGGLDPIDKYNYAPEDQITAGALLAIGILNSGVRVDAEPALALLSDDDNINSKNVAKRVASIMGLGLACAGTNKEELLEMLLPIVEDTSLDMQISAMAALSLGLIFVGSGNDRVSEAIITTLLDEDRQKQLKDKWTRFMSLGLALLFFGRQEEVEVIIETLKAIDHPMAKPASVLAEVCAWAGTGTVLKLQELLHICNDHIEDGEEKKWDELLQTYAVIGLSLIAMGEDVGQEMVLRQFGHLMHYGEANIRKAVPLAMGLISPSNPQMKVYDTLSRYSHDNDNDVAINAIFAMGMLGAGTNNARLAQLLRQLASYYHRDQNSLFMVRIAQGLVHMGKGTMSINPFHTDRQVLSRVAAAGLLTVLIAMIDAKQFILSDSHYLLYFIVTAMHPRFLVTLDEDLKPLQVNVRVGQAVDVVGQAGRPKTITGWQTQNTPVLLAYGERAELEDEQYISLASNLEGLVILRKNPAWDEANREPGMTPRKKKAQLPTQDVVARAIKSILSLPSRMSSPTPTAPMAGLSGRLRHVQSRQSQHGSSPIAEAAIARDLEDECDDRRERALGDGDVFDDGDESDDSFIRAHGEGRQSSMVASYRRPSFSIAGGRATVAAGLHSPGRGPTRSEREEARRQERSLLRDNNIIPPKHPQKGPASQSLTRRVSQQFKSLGIPGGNKEVVPPDRQPAEHADASESTPLIGNPELPYGGQDSPENIDKQWTEAVAAGKIHTTWQREVKVLSRFSAPLIVTFILQYSLTVASVFTVGHLGKVELGAVSLASMTAVITGYAVYQGLATSLDTLCPQAYGSGNKQLVGLQAQRMVYFLWAITVPIAIIWLSAEAILVRIVPEAEVARLAGLYLKILLLGAPGYAAFESAKRYVQAQGLFSASLYVLLICAPLNAFMNWLFVWRFGWGFVGAPIAVAVTETLLPILLISYIYFVAGSSCWPGFTKRALRNWGPMIRLALPGLLMVLAECLAFEILTLASSYFGTTHLAAQSVMSTIASMTFQIPFPISIAASTRVANLIGAGLASEARITVKVAFCAAAAVGLLNLVLISSLRGYIPRLFTKDEDVIALVAEVLPIVAALQLFDALACVCNGTLRGLGRQEIGGWVQLFCYYVVAMPISMGAGFGLGWKLFGFWSGVALALALVTVIESVFLYNARWEKSVEDAERRNAAG
ncbi:MAG: hypothetical protein Q9203_000784 [Teloschistes exilis]